MKRLTIFSISCMMFLTGLFAQNEADVLRYSRTTIGGTARSMSMAGAFGALGADFSTLSSNPAGIGLYKKSEFSITPSFYLGNTASTHYGNSTSDNRNNFSLSNAGVVITTKTSQNKSSILKYFQFAFGVNRVNDFNNRVLIAGDNPDNSIIETYVDDANGYNWEDIEQDYYGEFAYDLHPAWWSYLIDTLPGFDDRYHSPLNEGGALFQRKELNTWGSQNEMVLSLGANISDRLYIGGTFGFPFIRYFQQSNYYEIDENDDHPQFFSYQLYDELKTTGSGFNMKFGMIVRATNWFRFGGAIHSPTWYGNMRDEWYNEMTVKYDNWDTVMLSPLGNYDYELETPWRATGSVSFVLWKIALINGDYEYVDYSQAKLRGVQYNFYDENKAIGHLYKSAHHIRLGTEIRFDHFAIRGGYGIYGSPYNNEINDGKKTYYSGGIGFRDQNFFIDLAYVRSVYFEDYYLYGSENVNTQPVSNKIFTDNVLLTLGFRF